MAVLLFVLLTVKVLIHMCEYTFSLYYRILIQGDMTHPLIFIVCTINFMEYLQRYQIPIFIYYKLNFIIFFYYNTVRSVCCRYTSCNLKLIVSIQYEESEILFIYIVLGNIADF